MSSYSVDVTFKVTAVYELCNNKLLKGWHGAGIESQLFLEELYKSVWENHISYTQGGRNCF